MANLRSTLTVSLTDDVSGPANRAAGALHKLGASGNDLKRLNNASTGKLAADLERLNKAAGQVKGLRDATKALGQSGTEFRAARQNVTQLTTALAKAEERLASLKGQRGAEDQRIAAQREVQGIKRDLRAATAVMQETKGAYLDQGRAVRSLQGELKGAGVSLRNLHRQETQLAQATARTNAALSMREAMLGPRGRLSGALRSGATDAMAARMGEGDHRRQLNERYGARMLEGMGAPSRGAAARSEAAAQAAEARAARRAEARAGRREAAGTVGAAAGVAAGHFIEHGAHASLETYREFDKERRFGKAVMGISDEEQEPLIHQAIHMGASTRYNDVAVMESQRELAARGLKKDQVMGLMEPAANLGQSLDLKLPDAVKQMEGAIFGFKKNISTLADAQKSAAQTADIQVKAAKISGMTPEDITQTYKYGATPARMAGMSEASLLAFAGISKKANMGGDEAGVAFRALVANAMSPTRGAKEAMLANGMDYKNYQRMPDRIDTDAFTRTVSAQYGVQLDKATKGKLDKIFTDKNLIADPSKFTPAVMNLLSDSLDGDDAKSKKSIAGLANRFRDKSMKGVDTDRLVEDLMTAIPKNPALANAIFGSKQGARIANALGDPDTFKHMLEELIKHSQGYAEKIAKERQAGFDGAMDRLKGATMNLETAVGRAWDNNGRGGLLTKGTDLAGKAVQGLAELDAKSLLASTAMLGLAGSIGSVAGALRLAGTFMGLPALTALGGMTAAIGAATLAATGFAAALYVLSDEKKGIVHGGKPDGQLNPQDELPGLGSDPDLPQAPTGPGLPPRMSLADGVPSLLSEKHEALYQGLAEANEQAAKLRKELAEARAEADGMAGISVPGIADAAKAKVTELEKQKREVDDRIRSMRLEMEGRKPSLPPGGAQPSSRAAEGVPSLIDAASGRNAGAMAKAREELAAYERDLEAVNARLAKQASTGMMGFGGGLEGRKAELEGMIEAVRDKIQAIGRETIAPKADASGLDPLKAGLVEVKDKAAEVNALVIRPQADGGNLGTIIQQMRTIIALGPAVSAAASGGGGGGNTGAVRRAVGNNH